MAPTSTNGRTKPLIGISNHDAVLMRVLSDVLDAQGFDSMILPSGSTAYEVIKKEKPNLIMLDTGSQNGGDAWTLFQILRLDEETIQIPVLICSDMDGYANTAASLRHHSSVQVLPQPYDSDVLVPKIQAMLEDNENSKTA